jgi:hypothetical protein
MFVQKILSKTACAGIMLAAFSQFTYAETSPLKAEMNVFKVTDVKKNTKKELKATDQVKPKEVLEYQVNYSNVSSDKLKGLKLNLPIPTHVSYIGTSSPNNAFASVDGVNFEKAPLTRVVNGKKVMVPLNEYRALQWQVNELKPKQKISVHAQVRVNASE